MKPFPWRHLSFHIDSVLGADLPGHMAFLPHPCKPLGVFLSAGRLWKALFFSVPPRRGERAQDRAPPSDRLSCRSCALLSTREGLSHIRRVDTVSPVNPRRVTPSCVASGHVPTCLGKQGQQHLPIGLGKGHVRHRLVLSTGSVYMTVQNCSRVSPGEAGMHLEHGGKGCEMDAGRWPVRPLFPLGFVDQGALPFPSQTR